MHRTYHTDQYRVLLVDDDTDTNEYYATLLESRDYEVRIAYNGEQALQINADFRAHLAIIDLVLPNENGIDVLDSILQQQPETRCLILTAYAEIDSALTSLRHGAVDYISKSIGNNEFLEAIERASEKLKLLQARKAAEDEVKTRNTELSKTNQRLLREISERTHAEARLLKAMDELEIARNELEKSNNELEQQVETRTQLLSKNQARLEAIIEATADAILVVDDAGKVLHTNKYFQQVWNIPDELMATGDDTKLLEFVTNQLAHPDEFIALVTSLNNSNRQSLDKIEFIDGRVLERFSTPLDKDNIQEGRVWSFRDITERVHFDKTLAESEQKYRGIHEASSEGCWIIDPVTTETLDINESLCSLIGYHRDEIIGKTPMEFVDNENKEILRAQTSKILTTQHRHYDVALRHKNGSNIPCIFNASTIYIDDEAKFSVAFVTDITEHVQAKRVLQVARQEAENANKAKSEFLSRMSHELRTPLNAVLGFGQLLQIDNENFSEIQKKGIDHIYNSGKHLLELINEVLDIAKVDAGKMTVNIEDISVNEFIDDSISMVYSLTRKKHINISRTPVDINYHIKADKLRFKQVLLNLLSNAAKYNNEGGSITIDQVASEDGMLRILVTDTGPGIQTKDHIKVFAPFTRLGTHHNIEGTGVGLTITRKLVKLMGGDIDFSSEYGKGSTFWVELPCSNCEQ